MNKRYGQKLDDGTVANWRKKKKIDRRKRKKEQHISGKEQEHTCETCKYGQWKRNGWDITMADDICGGCCSWNDKWTPQDKYISRKETE